MSYRCLFQSPLEGVVLTIEATTNVVNMRQETALHVQYCKGFDLSEDDMRAQEESLGVCGSRHV